MADENLPTLGELWGKYPDLTHGVDSVAYVQIVRDFNEKMAAERQAWAELWDAATKRVEKFAELTQGWDSYDGAPIDARAIDVGKVLIRLLSKPPTPVPTSRGGVQLEWHGEGLSVEIVVPATGAPTFWADPEGDAELEADAAALRAEREEMRNISVCRSRFVLSCWGASRLSNASAACVWARNSTSHTSGAGESENDKRGFDGDADSAAPRPLPPSDTSDTP